MSSKTIVLITGGNTGLGFATVEALAASLKPYEIIIGSRSLEKAEAAIKTVSTDAATSVSAVQVDVEDDDSIAKAAETIKSKFGRLDVLVNNAGAQYDPEMNAGKMSRRDAWNKSWNTNVTGIQIITSTLVPLLLESSAPRIVFITSGLSTLEEATTNLNIKANHSPEAGWPKGGLDFTAYRSTKTGMNMMAVQWARILKNDGVKVNIVSPGMLATDLGGSPETLKAMGAIPPSVGAGVVRGAIEGERDDALGKVIRRTDVQPW